MNFEQDDNRLLQCSKFGGTVVLATHQRAPLIKSAPRLRCTVAKGEPPECDLRREGTAGAMMVPGGGFEPPTRGFSIRCSTN